MRCLFSVAGPAVHQDKMAGTSGRTACYVKFCTGELIDLGNLQVDS